MELYSAPGTCATAMHITLEWIGKASEVKHHDFTSMKYAEYMKTNASGVVRTLAADPGVQKMHGAQTTGTKVEAAA